MAATIICPNLRCRKVLFVPDEVRGKQVKCQHCQTLLRVPEERKAASATTAGPVAARTSAR